jgi:hypothetical protein
MGMTTGAVPPQHAHCLNCDAPLTGPWCARCGQKDPHPDLTLQELVHDAVHELSHWDGKVLSTFRVLLTRPGQLTVDFLAGRRARWLPPLRLYLIASVAYFLVGPAVRRFTHQPDTAAIKVTLPDSLFAVSGSAAAGSRALRPDVAAAFDSSRVGRVLGAKRIERVTNDPQAFSHAVRAAFPKTMFVLMPLFALLLLFAWRDAQPLYVPHLYFSLHLHAFAFAAMTVAQVPELVGMPRTAAWAGRGFLLALVVYAFLAFRRVYGGSAMRTLFRCALVGVEYLVVFLAVISMVGILAVLTL